MTIGIGILCSEGMVFCADQQITQPGGHKFYEEKLYKVSGHGWSVVFTYAGSPDLMKGFLGAFSDHMASVGTAIDCEVIRSGIETVLATRYLSDDIAKLELLCGAVIWGKGNRLFKNQAYSVGDAKSGLNIVGCGESSVLRYLESIVANWPIKTMNHAMWTAVYLIQAAKKWLDGCGGPTDLWVVLDSGAVVTKTSLVANIERVAGMIESLTANVMSDFFAMVDETQLETELRILSTRFREEYSKRKNSP